MRRLSRPAMLVVAVVLATGCSSRGGVMAVPTTIPAPPPGSDVSSFSVTAATVESVGPPAPPFPDDLKAGVVATLDRYLQDAVLGPLRSGGPAGDLGPVFTGPARARVDGPDRAALVDEGLPAAAAAKDVKAEMATARLAALVGADGTTTLVTAGVDLLLRTGGDDAVTIVRTGHFVLVPDAGGWKIDGYDVRTTRDGGGGATTTTAHG